MSATITAKPQTGKKPRRWGWTAFVFINALIIFFGLSYIFFPMGTVVQDGNQTTGIVHVPRELWGSFVVTVAVTMLVVAVVGLRQGARWAWKVLWGELPFLILVAIIEPDVVVPTLFAVILGVVLWRAYRGLAD